MDQNRKVVKPDFIKRSILALIILISGFGSAYAQKSGSLTLDEAFVLALENNHLLNIKRLQTREKEEKVKEDRVKYLPVIGLGGSYQYNSNLAGLTIEQGRFGELPLGPVTIPLPAMNEVFEMGQHNIYNAGVTFYQPVTQIGKINSGVNYSKTEYQVAKVEEEKAIFLVKQGVEKLFYGLLIAGKQIEEAGIKVELAELKLADGKNALAAGKALDAGINGLAASLADEEQNLLKIRIQYEDLLADLRQVTGIVSGDSIRISAPEISVMKTYDSSADSMLTIALSLNNDIKIATLNRTKADYSISASKYSYLPDLGITGGYTWQEGMEIYPRNNLFIGASLKWNLNDVLSNRKIQKQRLFLKQQAEENLLNTKEQVERDIQKAFRKLRQSGELIRVASKVREYRLAEFRIQSERFRAGLCLKAELLNARAALVKSESDLYAAELNYRISLSDLRLLTGTW